MSFCLSWIRVEWLVCNEMGVTCEHLPEVILEWSASPQVCSKVCELSLEYPYWSETLNAIAEFQIRGNLGLLEGVNPL